MMLQEHVLYFLRTAKEPLSGEGISRRLGVSRTAVWKAVSALREMGYTIEALPTQGYRLLDSPDLLTPGELFHPNQTIAHTVICLPTVDSTNDECKRQATQGAPDGLAVTADCQCAGKGRRGRSFQSLEGQGLYLSVLLRPKMEPETVSRITAWTAVAVCTAIERRTGCSPDIKWPNDILLEGKKLCGILTELGLVAETGEVDYVVVGMGVNLSQTEADFGPELSSIATSLRQHGVCIRRSELARTLLEELDRMYQAFPQEGQKWLAEYRRRCVTIGQPVRVIRPGWERSATALDVDDAFALRVRWEDGGEEAIASGEVSVRGLLGYF